MKFLADENFKLRAVKWLRKLGHDVKILAKGLSDIEVGVLAKKEERIILTHDADFSDSFKFPPSRFPGIIWFSLRPPTFENVIKSLKNLLKKFESKDFSGRLIIVSDIDKFEVKEGEAGEIKL